MSLKRLREGFWSAFDTLDPEDDVLEMCPDADVIYNACHGMLPAAEFAEVTDHMARCPVCAEAYRMAMNTPPPAEERSSGPHRH